MIKIKLPDDVPIGADLRFRAFSVFFAIQEDEDKDKKSFVAACEEVMCETERRLNLPLGTLSWIGVPEELGNSVYIGRIQQDPHLW